jgi:hypothetical protein
MSAQRRWIFWLVTLRRLGNFRLGAESVLS